MARSTLRRVGTVLAAAVCAAALLLPSASVEAAKFIQGKRIPVAASHHPRFPTHEELATRADLREKYAGDNKLTVHVVPHTHDDVGWLKTVDQYYLGANNSIQHAAVNYILTTVVEELQKNPARKFIYVEQAFFQMWHERQSADTQAAVKKLVATGQLEFINGGWCMHDEAATHWIDMMDQTTLGHQFIKKEFGVTPKIGWQIDPFGHSSTQAALLSAKVGFEGLFFGRIDHVDHDARIDRKDMEFVWRASPSLGDKAQVFSGAFQNGNYGPPDSFCFDWFCGDAPMVNDKSFIDYNIPTRVQQFLDQINGQASHTKGTNLMITMGSDFQYEHAREWYENMDKLIDAVQADGRINIQYSTPSLYVEAKNAENITFSVKTDDFFPYSDGDHSPWTGYFVSRPALKRYVRTSSAFLQTARQMELFAGGDGSNALSLEKAVGVVQHHDAVAGTAKQHVSYDYAQRLSIASADAGEMMRGALMSFTTNNHPSQQPEFAFCELANISVCAASVNAAGPVQITLWNSLGRARTELVTVPVASANMVVLGHDGTTSVQAQVLHVHNVSSHTTESTQLSLNFLATVPGLGFRTFFIQPAAHSAQVFHEEQHARSSLRARARAIAKASTWVSASVPAGSSSGVAGNNADVTLENELVAVTISGVTCNPTTIIDKTTNKSTPFVVTWGYYESYQGDGQKSGAYIFRPAQQHLERLTVVPKLIVQSGPVVNQVTFLVNEYLNHTLRVVVGAQNPSVAVEYTVGEIPVVEDKIGKEVVIQYTTGLATESMWFSDSNAREMLPRVRNARFSYNLTQPLTEPISNNYVPMNAAAYITDKNAGLTLTVLNDRSQGVASQADGELEVMIHRRILQDDGRGVGEPLNETDAGISPYYGDNQATRRGHGLVITGTHYLFFGAAATAAKQWRPAAQRVYAPFTPFFASLGNGVSAATYSSSHVTEMSWIKQDLPVNVEAVTVSAWGQWVPQAPQGTMLLRLAHMFGLGEDNALSAPVQIDLDNFFPSPAKSVTPVSLTVVKTADQAKDELLEWDVEGANADANGSEHIKDDQINGSVVTLNTLDVQSFLVSFA